MTPYLTLTVVGFAVFVAVLAFVWIRNPRS
jgi:hypothetical protein